MPDKINVDNRSMFTGDNLEILRGLNSDSVDLIYADPPRNSGEELKARGMSRAKGFEFTDKWTVDDARPEWEDEIAVRQPDAMHIIDAFRLVQDEGAVSYLVFLAVRLLELQRVLKETGSIYLQCRQDSTHYLKAIMDAIFGREQFKSDITYKRVVQTAGPKMWHWAHDTLLFYAGPRKHRWNVVPQPHTPEFLSRYAFTDERGQYQPSTLTQEGLPHDGRDATWRGYDPGEIGRQWEVPLNILQRYYPERSDLESLDMLEKLDLLDACGMVHLPIRGSVPRYKKYLDTSPGEALSDVVTTIGQIDQKSQEGTGWPGQVPKALLDIIIRASSNEGDIILDPFSGSGTACVVAENRNRRWVGIEGAPEGFDVLESRMRREAHQTEIYRPRSAPWRTDEKEADNIIPGPRTKHALYEKQFGKCEGCLYELPIHVLTTAVARTTQKAQKAGIDTLQLLCHHCRALRGQNDDNYLSTQLFERGIRRR